MTQMAEGNDDLRYMQIALELASRATIATSPNPKVSCVIVRDGVVIGEGWTQSVGQAHAEVQALRNRQAKNFLTLNLIALGTPMLLMGDEVRRSQEGNNNAYCQDNETSWLDWGLLLQHADLLRFTQILIRYRVARDPEVGAGLTLSQLLRSSYWEWHGTSLHQPDWRDQLLRLVLQSIR